MTRKTFDKIVTSIGALLTVFLLVAAALLNWGATFASDSVASQLEAQKITMPKAADFSPDTDPDVLAYFVSRDGELMSTGKDAQMYADHYIALHMSNMPTYAEASGAARSAIGEDKVAKEAIVETVFRGNMLRGTLLTAYAFGILGAIAGYGTLAALIGGLLMLVLTVAGYLHIRRTPESATI
jgi:hypothetical protein